MSLLKVGLFLDFGDLKRQLVPDAGSQTSGDAQEKRFRDDRDGRYRDDRDHGGRPGGHHIHNW